MPAKAGHPCPSESTVWIVPADDDSCARPMKLSDLLTGLAALDARTGAIEVAGVTADSRKVKRGDVFVAVPGTKADGLAFAAQAARGRRRGDHGRGQRAGAAGGRGVRQGRQRAARARACWRRRFYPRQPQMIAAVTGTSGKTSVAAFTRQIWAALGHRGRQHRHHRRRDAASARSTAR